MVIRKITTEDFDQEIVQEKGTALIDFYADWCGPCQQMAPMMEELAEEIDVQILKLNVDEEPNLAQKYGIMSIPTLIFFREGQAEKKSIGVVDKAEIKEMIQ